LNTDEAVGLQKQAQTTPGRFIIAKTDNDPNLSYGINVYNG